MTKVSMIVRHRLVEDGNQEQFQDTPTHIDVILTKEVGSISPILLETVLKIMIDDYLNNDNPPELEIQYPWINKNQLWPPEFITLMD